MNNSTFFNIIVGALLLSNTILQYFFRQDIVKIKRWMKRKEGKDIPIYVLDDNPDDLDFTERWVLQKLENKYELFMYGEKMGSKLGNETAIFIINHFMPGMDGIEMAKKIKAANPDNWLIVFTAAESTDVFSQYTKLKIDRFVSKNDTDKWLLLSDAIKEGVIIISNK